MKIEPIGYSASYESVNAYGLKKWEKISLGANISNDDDPIQCLQELKNKVNEFYLKSNSEEKIEFKYTHQESKDVIVDEEFEQLKKQLDSIEYKEDAELLVSQSNFKYSIEAKQLVNLKPNKS